jgi:acetoin utilization deacetylase AcuC-like enzyme
MGDVTVVYDELMLEHRPERVEGWTPAVVAGSHDAPGGALWTHPERPERLSAVRELLDEQPIEGIRLTDARPAAIETLARVHRLYYLDYIDSLRGTTQMIDPDTTAVSPRTVDAAKMAAGAAVRAVDAVFESDSRRAMALVRPPGHHAMQARAMGFCFYNNVAVAAAHARENHGCERILIVDWDVHHGNGTQEIFYADPDVLVFDTHCAAPFYPGTGALDEIGRYRGVGKTVNVPLPLGCDDRTMLSAYTGILTPLADMFQPDLVLVSAGFDAHQRDQAMVMTDDGFAALCGAVSAIADRHAGGRLALTLEGGYHASSIASSSHACLRVLAGAEPPPIGPPDPAAPGAAEIAAARQFHGLA